MKASYKKNLECNVTSLHTCCPFLKIFWDKTNYKIPGAEEDLSDLNLR